MMKLKLMAALVMGTTLVACGGSSSSGDSTSSASSSSSECTNPFGCDVVDNESELDITLQELPYVESFSHNSFVAGANNAEIFFSTGYKALNTEYPQTFEDGTTLDDPEPFFNYPTAGFWEVVNNERIGLNPDLDYQIYVGEGYLALSNARFTVGQALTDLVTAQDSEANDAKNRTSGLSVGNVSWGEFDLSVPYRISFCVKDAGATTGGTGGNLEVWVDNNAGGQQDQSMHGAESMVLRQAAPSLTERAGHRLVIDVPGNVRFVDAEGATVGDNLDSKSVVIGTETSFLQLRVSSGGYAVISDFVVEHQSGPAATYQPCTADDSLYEQAPPPTAQGVPFQGLPLLVDLGVSKNQFFGLEDTAGFVANSDSATTPFYHPGSSAGRVYLEDGTIRFGNALWTMGFKSAPTTTAANGDINLSVPYTIEAEIVSLPEGTAGNLQVQIDNASGAGANSVHDTDSRIFNVPVANLTTGVLVINVPGEITLNGEPIAGLDPLENLIGTPASSITFRCDSNCASTALVETEGGGVVLRNIEVSYQGEGPGDGGSGEGNYTWGFSAEAYEEAKDALFEGGTYNPEGDSRIAVTEGEVEADGLLFSSTSAGVLRFRFVSQGEDEDDLAVWNTNGAFFSNNTTVFPAVGEPITGTVRTYIAIPVESGRAVTLELDYSQNSSVEFGKVAFVANDGTLLAAEDADLERVGSTLSVTLDATHTYEHVKILYGRETATGGGINMLRIERTYAE